MREILFFTILQLATALAHLTTIVTANTSSAYNHTTTLEDPIHDGKTILHLRLCPDSTRDNLILQQKAQDITPFFEKYGFEDHILGVINTNSSIMATFSEQVPDCEPNMVSISKQLVCNLSSNPEHCFLPNGWIVKFHSDEVYESISPDKYCILSGMNEKDDSFVIKYCDTDCRTHPCITKCCFANEVCDLSLKLKNQTEIVDDCECADSGKIQWTSTVEKIWERKFSFMHHIYQDEEACDVVYFTLHQESKNLIAPWRNDFQILDNGSVQFHRKFDNQWISLPERKYCVDGAGYSQNFSGEISDMVLRLCRNKEDLSPVKPAQQHFILHMILVPFGLVFLFLTITVYVLTWSEQRTYGYTIFSYMVTLLALYAFIVAGNMHTHNYSTNRNLCLFVAGAIHFFYLSSACWITCVSFHVWRRFKNMNVANFASLSPSRAKRRFTNYCLFSIGYPFLQVAICAVLDYAYRNVPADQVPIILPHYGQTGICNMSNDGVTYYLYGPIALLLVSNTGFFIATINSMIRYKKSIRHAFMGVSNETRSSGANQSFGIYARLFIIMGIFWMSQIISWFVLVDNKDTTTSLEILFNVTDALTVLQAVALFYIFVCKRNVFDSLWTSHPWLHPFLSLWVKSGFCIIPAPDARKQRHTRTSLFGADPKAGTTKKTAPQKDVNSNSSLERKAKIHESCNKNSELARHTSISSNDGSSLTTISEVDEDIFDATADIRKQKTRVEMDETKL